MQRLSEPLAAALRQLDVPEAELYGASALQHALRCGQYVAGFTPLASWGPASSGGGESAVASSGQRIDEPELDPASSPGAAESSRLFQEPLLPPDDDEEEEEDDDEDDPPPPVLPSTSKESPGAEPVTARPQPESATASPNQQAAVAENATIQPYARERIPRKQRRSLSRALRALRALGVHPPAWAAS